MDRRSGRGSRASLLRVLAWEILEVEVGGLTMLLPWIDLWDVRAWTGPGGIGEILMQRTVRLVVSLLGLLFLVDGIILGITTLRQWGDRRS